MPQYSCPMFVYIFTGRDEKVSSFLVSISVLLVASLWKLHALWVSRREAFLKTQMEVRLSQRHVLIVDEVGSVVLLK